MLIFLALLYISLVSTRAAPLDIVSGGNTPNNLVLPTYVSPPNHRSVFGIIWSCFVTLSLCTWTSVYPNIPGVDVKPREVTWEKFEMMICALFTPELILFWASGQHSGAANITKKVNSLCNVNWTTTHGQFVQMGGFMLMDENANRSLLTAEKFLELLEQKKIDLPPITKDEILDRSKGDDLSKVIAIVQTIWFIIQFCLRLHQGLIITEIEWFTVALTYLPISLNFYWWSKPLDVRAPILVNLQHGTACTLVRQALEPAAGPSSERQSIEMTEQRPPLNQPNQLILFKPLPGVVTELPKHYFYWDKNQKSVIQSAARAFVATFALATFHLLAWFYGPKFPSRVESFLWIFLTGALFYVGVYALLLALGYYIGTPSGLTTIEGLGRFYMIVRILLLGLAFVELRHLPPKALDKIQWPHWILFFFGN